MIPDRLRIGAHEDLGQFYGIIEESFEFCSTVGFPGAGTWLGFFLTSIKPVTGSGTILGPTSSPSLTRGG